MNQIWESAFAEFDLSPSHAYLLRLVLAEPGLTPKQIAGELKLEKSTITRFLDALEQKSMIQRQKGLSGDAREQCIYATRKAEKLATALEAKGNVLYQKMVDSIGKNNLSALVVQLRNIESKLI